MNAAGLTGNDAGERLKTEPIDPVHAARMAAVMAGRVLDAPAEAPAAGDPLPPGWHWCWFADAEPAVRLGRDGHPTTGGFIPDTGLPRRMWAGGRLTFHAPLEIGMEATRRSHVAAVERKSGRSGPLAFVTIRHDIAAGDRALIGEEQHLVYREDPKPDAPQRQAPHAPAGADFSREIDPDPVWLFRYSAVTFNGHRIHYDHEYARDVEGYPSIVVHGPLIATLLMDLAVHMRGGEPLRRFSYRAASPLFCDRPFSIHGKQKQDGSLDLWAADDKGRLAMRAEAESRQDP